MMTDDKTEHHDDDDADDDDDDDDVPPPPSSSSSSSSPAPAPPRHLHACFVLILISILTVSSSLKPLSPKPQASNQRSWWVRVASGPPDRGAAAINARGPASRGFHLHRIPLLSTSLWSRDSIYPGLEAPICLQTLLAREFSNVAV